MLNSYDIVTPSELVDRTPELFWREGQLYPSILLRELAGLKAFGYRTHWTSIGLSFVMDDTSKVVASSHQKYLDVLSCLLSDRVAALETMKDFLDTTQSNL